MKQNIRIKLFGLTLTAALALTALTACGNGVGTAALPETSGTSTPFLEESGGQGGPVLAVGTEKLGDGFSVLCRTHLGSGGPVQGVYQEEVLTGERLGGGGGREGAYLRLFRRNLLVLAGHQPAAG